MHACISGIGVVPFSRIHWSVRVDRQRALVVALPITHTFQEVALKNKFLSAAVVAVLAMATTSLVFAGGYQVNEHNARAMGMGGAFVAIASDASAVFFNPAGLAFQKGFSVLGGGTFIMPSSSFTSIKQNGTGTRPDASMKSQTFFPPNLYLAYNMDNLTLGLGVFAPYGLGTEWDSKWDGRFSAVKTDLQALYINPSVGYRIDDQWSVGAGISYVTGTAKLNRKIRTFSSLGPPPSLATTDGDITLDGSGSGFTFNVGVLYKASDKLSAGLAYRHVTKVKYEGDAKFTNMQALASFFPGGTGSVELPMPTNIQAGVAYKITDEFIMAADLQFVQWDAYDKLTIVLPNGPAPTGLAAAIVGPNPLQTTQVQVKNWKNSMIYRVGGEYRMEKLALRAGFLYDGTPQISPSVEPLLPDANRIEFTLGAGYMVSEMVSVDLAYQFISASDRKGSFVDLLGTTPVASYAGTYKTTANLFGVSIGLHF